MPILVVSHGYGCDDDDDDDDQFVLVGDGDNDRVRPHCPMTPSLARRGESTCGTPSLVSSASLQAILTAKLSTTPFVLLFCFSCLFLSSFPSVCLSLSLSLSLPFSLHSSPLLSTTLCISLHLFAPPSVLSLLMPREKKLSC